jgi:FMN phosphatase YigB (HAD superfamily)
MAALASEAAQEEISMFQAINRKGYAAFRRASLDEATKVVSVDVFDTLLLRTTKPEPARFLDIGQRQLRILLENGASAHLTAHDMLILRLMAARAAYRNARHVDGVREPGYGYIARIILGASGIRPSDSVIEDLVNAELDYESAVLAPNRVLVNILKQARKAGKRVICISDMYLSAKQIETLIRNSGIDFIDAVYASSDFGYGKASRRLFEKVLEIEQVEKTQLIHCGDNPVSDYRIAIESGIKAYHTPRGLHWRAVERARRRLFGWRHRLSSL